MNSYLSHGIGAPIQQCYDLKPKFTVVLESTRRCYQDAFNCRMQRRSLHSNMAAAVRMKTWSCPTTRVLYSRTVFFVFLLSAIEAVVAAPEPGVWKITVGNVSTTRRDVYLPAFSRNVSISYVSCAGCQL